LAQTVGTILHVDMDAFYASIEQRDNPEFRGKPVVVGSSPNKRGVVCTCSYEARQYGIHSAMPSSIAYQCCPQAIFVPPRGNHYAQVSKQVMKIFYEITPFVEQLSIDEAFLDLSSTLRIWNTPYNAAKHIQKTLQNKLQLTASIGIATNKFLAKLASDYRKPNGITIVPTGQQKIIEFLAPLSVRRIWGVGKVMGKQLAKVGIHKISDLQKSSKDRLIRLLGSGQGEKIWHLAHGIDFRNVEQEAIPEKSISRETTFNIDCSDRTILKQQLILLVEDVCRCLRKTEYAATVAQIKLRFSNFKTITRRITLEQPQRGDQIFLKTALQLFSTNYSGEPIRLIGFALANLVDKNRPIPKRQIMLFPQEQKEQKQHDNPKLDQAVDRLREQFGVNIICRGNIKNNKKNKNNHLKF